MNGPRSVERPVPRTALSVFGVRQALIEEMLSHVSHTNSISRRQASSTSSTQGVSRALAPECSLHFRTRRSHHPPRSSLCKFLCSPNLCFLFDAVDLVPLIVVRAACVQRWAAPC